MTDKRDKQTNLTLSLDAGPGAPDEERAELMRHLRQRLLDLDVEKVDLIPSGPAPQSAKGDPITLAAVAVTLAPAAIKALIGMLQSWLLRHETASVTVEAAGEKLTMTGTLSPQQQQLVETFLKRHKG